MTMLRPSGKALKIAEDTIPGLNLNKKIHTKRKTRKIHKESVELRAIKDNKKNKFNPGPNRKKTMI